MVIHSESEWNDIYTARMISGNKIPCLLYFQEKTVDGQVMFYYDITSKQPLNRLLDHRKLTASELQTLITDLILLLRQMERYLLDERKLCLKPEYIYLEPESYHGSFCLIPGHRSEFANDFLELAQYFLDHVDHGDGDAVMLAFAIFQECRKENFGVDDIERCLIKEDSSEAAVEKVVEDKIELEPPEDIIEKEEYSEESVFKGKQALAVPLLIVSGIVILPLIIVLLFGVDRLFQWKWGILATEMMLASGFIFLLRDKKDMNSEKQSNEIKPISGESFLIDELWNWEEKEEAKESTTNIGPAIIADEDDMQTVLLTSHVRDETTKKLVSVSDREEISINYFPFIIGKNKSMTDHCLNKPGVSRLHVKLEMVNTKYYITDLNSTNGTKINGESLNANETKQLYVGDELDIAGYLFRFQ